MFRHSLHPNWSSLKLKISMVDGPGFEPGASAMPTWLGKVDVDVLGKFRFLACEHEVGAYHR